MRTALIFLPLIWTSSCQINDEPTIRFPSGGHSYVKEVPVTEHNNYFYPIKYLLSRKDSLENAFYLPYFYSAFDEPNLSIRPTASPIFRLTFQSSYIGYVAVITLTDDKIIVKEKKTGHPNPYPDPDKLNSLEREHLLLLKRYYPVGEYSEISNRKKLLDSIGLVYPKLHDPKYYFLLLDKSKAFDADSFMYITWTIPISQKLYRTLIDSFNQSGYWKMNYWERGCLGKTMHSDDFSLEAATPEKFQIVNFAECPEPPAFQRACEYLMRAGKVHLSFERYQDSMRDKMSQIHQ